MVDMSTKIQKLISADQKRKRCQTDRDLLPERIKHIDGLKAQVDALKKLSASKDERDQRKVRLGERAKNNADAIMKRFDVKETAAMRCTPDLV